MSNSIQLQFDDANLAHLHEVAEREGLTPQEFAQQTVLSAIHAKCGQSFQQAMKEVLAENKELFRRLAQ